MLRFFGKDGSHTCVGEGVRHIIRELSKYIILNVSTNCLVYAIRAFFEFYIDQPTPLSGNFRHAVLVGRLNRLIMKVFARGPRWRSRRSARKSCESKNAGEGWAKEVYTGLFAPAITMFMLHCASTHIAKRRVVSFTAAQVQVFSSTSME